MTKEMVMELVKDLMEKSGDLAIAVAKYENTSGLERSVVCALMEVEKAVDELTAK